jgi:hypothetical protein
MILQFAEYCMPPRNEHPIKYNRIRYSSINFEGAEMFDHMKKTGIEVINDKLPAKKMWELHEHVFHQTSRKRRSVSIDWDISCSCHHKNGGDNQSPGPGSIWAPMMFAGLYSNTLKYL